MHGWTACVDRSRTSSTDSEVVNSIRYATQPLKDEKERRGYLIVAQHHYYGPLKLGSYDAAYIFRPDGKEIMMTPAARMLISPTRCRRGWRRKAGGLGSNPTGNLPVSGSIPA